MFANIEEMNYRYGRKKELSIWASPHPTPNARILWLLPAKQPVFHHALLGFGMFGTQININCDVIVSDSHPGQLDLICVSQPHAATMHVP